MTILEAKSFYQQDLKKYEIAKNKEFLTWLKEMTRNGYYCYIEIEELQEMINNIVNWYEMKYPERELESLEGTTYDQFQDIKDISSVLDIRQLLFRLPSNQLSLMECGYRGCGGHIQAVDDKDKSQVQYVCSIYVKAKNKGKFSPFYEDNIIDIDCMTGELINYNYGIIEYLKCEKNIKIDKLLSILGEKYSDALDLSELIKVVNFHNGDMELRHKILELAALKMIYSENTIPERGYERAKRFIAEFNEKPGFNLSTEEIDEIMNRDYSIKTDGLQTNEVVREKVEGGLIKKFFSNRKKH